MSAADLTEDPSVEENSPETSQPIWRPLTLFLLTLGAVLLCGFLTRPFLASIVFAITTAVCTRRPYDWLAARIRNRSLCAAVALVILCLVGIVPGIFIGRELTRQIIAAIAAVRGGVVEAWFFDFAFRHPAIANQLNGIISSVDLNRAAQTAAGWGGRHILTFIGGIASILFKLVFLLFILFFLLRDRDQARGLLHSLLPMDSSEANRVIGRLHDTIYAIGFGRLAVAALQGVLGGLAYAVLGVPGATFWGFLTAVLATIPGFGAVLVWAPIALYLGFGGHWIKAVILAGWGGGVVSIVDNFLFPILVGPGMRSHTAIIFLSLLGGVAFFGPAGIILGPLLFSFAASLLNVWQKRTSHSSTTAKP